MKDKSNSNDTIFYINPNQLPKEESEESYKIEKEIRQIEQEIQKLSEDYIKAAFNQSEIDALRAKKNQLFNQRMKILSKNNPINQKSEPDIRPFELRPHDKEQHIESDNQGYKSLELKTFTPKFKP